MKRKQWISITGLGLIALTPSVDARAGVAGRCLSARVAKNLALVLDFKKSAEFRSELNRLLGIALGSGPEARIARSRVQGMLELDDLNWNYFFSLYQKKISGAVVKPIEIFEAGRNAAGKTVAYPTAIAPPELLKSLQVADYAGLARSSEHYSEAAKDAVLWVKKMQAGSGSSMTRTSYLAEALGVPEREVRIGAKGTDLFITLPDPRNPGAQVSIPVVEAQILQSILDHQRGAFREVVFHDILSSETRESLQNVWRKKSLLDPSKTYQELVEGTPGLRRFKETLQSYIPTIDSAEKVSFNREAPGGHALFGVDAIRAAYRDEMRPATQGRPLISAISNGEDLSGTPDPQMVGWMVKKKVPIALVTTEKTVVDGKGGILSLVKGDDGVVSLAVVETAQAKEAGQLKLYESLKGLASTNLTLFNYDVLGPLIKKEVAEVGEDEFMRIIAPDLIRNVKEQKDADGVVRKYLQLEGAMGSTLMNLDRYWRKKYGQGLVQIINVDRMHRTEFFSPIKFAFDYYMQFHSDRFAIDAATMRLRNLRPGELPLVSLSDPATKDKYYQDVKNVLQSFRQAKIRDLDSLNVEGQVDLHGSTLKGNVKIVNKSGKRADLSNRVLDNVSLVIE